MVMESEKSGKDVKKRPVSWNATRLSAREKYVQLLVQRSDQNMRAMKDAHDYLGALDISFQTLSTSTTERKLKRKKVVKMVNSV